MTPSAPTPTARLRRACRRPERRLFDAPTVFSGTGGSIPLTTLLAESFPSAELMLFGVEEPLSTIHSPDESVSPDEIISIAIAEALFLLNYI